MTDGVREVMKMQKDEMASGFLPERLGGQHPHSPRPEMQEEGESG